MADPGSNGLASAALRELGLRVAELPASQLPEMIGELARVQALLLARLTTGAQEAVRPSTEPERLLGAPEAAQRLGVSRRWLYAHAHDLPFARRLSPRIVRFSLHGLERWKAARRA